MKQKAKQQKITSLFTVKQKVLAEVIEVEPEVVNLISPEKKIKYIKPFFAPKIKKEKDKFAYFSNIHVNFVFNEYENAEAVWKVKKKEKFKTVETDFKEPFEFELNLPKETVITYPKEFKQSEFINNWIANYNSHKEISDSDSEDSISLPSTSSYRPNMLTKSTLPVPNSTLSQPIITTSFPLIDGIHIYSKSKKSLSSLQLTSKCTIIHDVDILIKGEESFWPFLKDVKRPLILTCLNFGCVPYWLRKDIMLYEDKEVCGGKEGENGNDFGFFDAEMMSVVDVMVPSSEMLLDYYEPLKSNEVINSNIISSDGFYGSELNSQFEILEYFNYTSFLNPLQSVDSLRDNELIFGLFDSVDSVNTLRKYDIPYLYQTLVEYYSKDDVLGKRKTRRSRSSYFLYGDYEDELNVKMLLSDVVIK